ncbi:uncharacterized protein PHALS_00728 [Plasmopara halstedii]|uniref:Uncharacterized protein n=1 Tax=Plasmopara halstedii TaxID=4781 RepID=A0A0P1AUQ5_PLAHL|nr:uncharacterized protein PHALS_00728 [Plasmopara halstedii]CEG44360.1 hypothetical protein PHALS_00728 [Plasmopara halstedii]|eukprot:XP_024580729.1 hypothetical protein PHALS_00728 [Plasmopara halstedii]
MDGIRSSRKSSKYLTTKPPHGAFSVLGGAVFHINSSASSNAQDCQPVSTTEAYSTRNNQVETEREFDVKAFLLNQKGSQPLHRSSLFQIAPLGEQKVAIDRSKNLEHSLLPQSKIGSSKSTSKLPRVASTKFRKLQSRQHSEEGDASGSRYYSIEKMSSRSLHATQNQNKTWLYIPGFGERGLGTRGMEKTDVTCVDRPCRRVDLLDLEQCFDTAIQFIDKNEHIDIASEEKLSMLDQDYMAIYAHIKQRYSVEAGETSSDSCKKLAKVLFEQKWSDLIIGELESMLTNSFLEQGVVLGKARMVYAKTFFELENIYKLQWNLFLQEKKQVEDLRLQVHRIDEVHEENVQKIQKRNDAEMNKLQTAFESEKRDLEQQVIDLKEQMMKMSDTMKTLNAIFRQMREDTENVKAMELHEKYNKLEHKYERCHKETIQLRPVVQEKQQLESKLEELTRDRDALRDKLTDLNNLCKQSLCIGDANKGSVDRVDNVDVASTYKTETHKPSNERRIQCLYYRVLLPNLNGYRPQRDVSWTLSCMRSIIYAKQLDNLMCKHTAGLFPLRIRMPEFVYAWFSPWRSLKTEKATSKRAEWDTSHANIQMQANEDRWCLYYGVKALVKQGYLEAKLFLSLLDERDGEDEHVFMLYCYHVLDITSEGQLNWGPLREKASYQIFSQQYDLLLGTDQTKGPASRVRVPKKIWIPLKHASLATSIVLSRATEFERNVLFSKMTEHEVKDVPEDERLDIYIKPPMEVKDELTKSLEHFENLVEDTQSHESPGFIDAHLWIDLMMHEYKEEQAHRRAAIRLMFQAATSTAVATSDSTAETGISTMSNISQTSMDMEQFYAMVHTLNDEVPSWLVAMLYRNAYTRGDGAVTFNSFMEAAEAWQFFSTCMRLKSPDSIVSSFRGRSYTETSVPISLTSRAASNLNEKYILCQNELGATIEQLPLWTRSMADSLAFDISVILHDDNFSEVRLLSLLQRLIDIFGVSKLIQREITGSLSVSSDLNNIEKALDAIMNFK